MAQALPQRVLDLSRQLAKRVAPPPVRLTFSSDATPGIRRRRSGRGFSYRDPDGNTVTDGDVLARIRKLAIPPAWTDVWICTDPGGHLQATGRDARGRKQYRYHAAWTERRGAEKFQGLTEFGRALPALREAVDRDLARPGLGRDRVVAMVVRLLGLTLIRVGNREYARVNGSYGLTTLLDQHVAAVRGRLRFQFRAKGGIDRDIRLSSRRLCALVRRCQELPGQTLFQYREEDGSIAPVTSAMVNAYLRERTGSDFTAKHVRTWAATVMAFSRLARSERPDSQAGRRRVVSAVLKEVSGYLGNTPTVCRQSYVHPAVLEAYEAGGLAALDLAEAPDWPTAEAETLAFLETLTRSGRAPARSPRSPAAASRTGASRAA